MQKCPTLGAIDEVGWRLLLLNMYNQLHKCWTFWEVMTRIICILVFRAKGGVFYHYRHALVPTDSVSTVKIIHGYWKTY